MITWQNVTLSYRDNKTVKTVEVVFDVSSNFNPVLVSHVA